MVSQKTTPKADTAATAPVDSTQPVEPVPGATEERSGAAEQTETTTNAGTTGSSVSDRVDAKSSSSNGRSEKSPAPTATSQEATDAEASTDEAAPDTAPTEGDVAARTAAAAPATGGTADQDAEKNGAVKAAAVALAAARTAAKKVQSAASAASAGISSAGSQGSAGSSTPPPPPGSTSSGPRPEMHYSAGGVRGTAQASADGSPQTGAQPAVSGAEGLGSPRRVRLSVSRIDPWSVMKLAFLLSVALGIMTVVATAVVWYSLNSVGTFATVQDFLIRTLGPQAVDITQIVEFERTVSLATLIALVDVVLFTAIATIMAMLYNITAALVGGVHLTLTDE